MENKTNLVIEAAIPLFSGFYGGYYETDEDSELEHINGIRVSKGFRRTG